MATREATPPSINSFVRYEQKMTNSDIADKIRRVLRSELDDCERALKNGDVQKAQSELEDAISKLKRLLREID
jgi:thioredoxin-like negative regulator of GroEL